MYAQKKTVENTHIVRERDRQRFRELFAVFSIGVPIGLFLLLFTWQNLEVIRLAREATRLQKIEQALQNENKTLRLQIEKLTALDEVESKAVKLGFRTTESKQIVIINSRSTEKPAGVLTR